MVSDILNLNLIHFCVWVVRSGGEVARSCTLSEGYCSAVILGVPEISKVQSGTEINMLLFHIAPVVYLDVQLFRTDLEISWAVIIGVIGACRIYRILRLQLVLETPYLNYLNVSFRLTFASVCTHWIAGRTYVVWTLEYTYVHNLLYFSLLLQSKLGNIWLTSLCSS